MKRCKNCFEEYDECYEVCPSCGYIEGSAAEEIFYLYPGTLLGGRYVIGKVLGFGGFGITYKAWDRKLDSVVAVKEYYPSGIANRAPGTKDVIIFAQNRVREYNHGLTRFLDEARNMAKFGAHSNIVNIYEYFEENSTAYLVMEFLDGVTLGDFMKNNALGVNTCVEIALRVADALKAVHGQGVLHRDVSPDNIFLCVNGAVKLIDFGAARFAAGEDRLLTIILKPGFAPPEQYERVNVQGPWTDIYALGATLYYMVTGVKPEESTNRRIQDDLPPPHVVNPGVPVNVSNAIMKAMAVDRHMRFESVEALEKGLIGVKKVIPLIQERKRRGRRRFAGVLAALLAVAAGGSVFAFTYNKEREAETLPDASIEIWYPLTGEAAHDAAKEEALKEIAAEFAEGFPGSVLEISVESYPAGEYESAIMDALAEGDGPALFELAGLGGAALESAPDLSDVIGAAEEGDCYFLGEYGRGLAERGRLPLGFNAPVVYVNTTLTEREGRGVSDLAGVGSDRESFLAGEAESYLGAASDFFDVQEALPARYRLMYADRREVSAEFTDVWSSAAEGDELKVAKRLLAYMLSENAQDYFHLRRRSGALPVNKNALGEYCGVYADFEGFFDNIDGYVLRAG
jgi:hypothetical protein